MLICGHSFLKVTTLSFFDECVVHFCEQMDSRSISAPSMGERPLCVLQVLKECQVGQPMDSEHNDHLGAGFSLLDVSVWGY